MEVRHACHCTYRIRYHMVFVLKYRKLLISTGAFEFMRKVCKQFPELKDELWGGEFWSDGGHIDTVGDGRGLEEVRKYVKNQGRDVSQLTLYEFASPNTPQLAAERSGGIGEAHK